MGVAPGVPVVDLAAARHFPWCGPTGDQEWRRSVAVAGPCVVVSMLVTRLRRLFGLVGGSIDSSRPHCASVRPEGSRRRSMPTSREKNWSAGDLLAVYGLFEHSLDHFTDDEHHYEQDHPGDDDLNPGLGTDALLHGYGTSSKIWRWLLNWLLAVSAYHGILKGFRCRHSQPQEGPVPPPCRGASARSTLSSCSICTCTTGQRCSSAMRTRRSLWLSSPAGRLTPRAVCQPFPLRGVRGWSSSTRSRLARD